MKEIITFKNRLIINSDDKSVTKFFGSKKEFEKELFIYKLHPAFAPRLLSYNANKMSISTRLIEGNTLINFQDFDFKEIAKLFYKLHTIADETICLIDTNPKNFLYSPKEDRYFIIDFSDWEYRGKEFDLIHFLLFWASLWKFEKFAKTTQTFLNEYNKLNSIDKSLWKDEVNNVILFFDKRREKYNKKEKKVNSDTENNRNMLRRLF